MMTPHNSIRRLLSPAYKRRVILGLYYLLIVGCSTLQAQNRDSLLGIWNNPQQPDTLRLQALQSVTWGLMNIYPDSSFQLATNQLNFARQQGLKKWEAKGLYNIGTYYYWKGEYTKSFTYYQQSLELRSQIGDLRGVAAVYGNFGLIYNQQGNNLLALDYQLKALALNTKIGDTLGITSNYNNLAMIYQDQANRGKALEYYAASLKLYDPVKRRREIALTYNNIGNVYSADSMPRKALQYLFKSLALRTELNDRLGMAITYTNIGSNYSNLAIYDTALIYIKKGAALFDTLGDKSGSSNTYYFLGNIAYKQNQYKDARQWYTKSLQLAREINKVPMQRTACYCLYQTYKAMGAPSQALAYHEQYQQLSDSLKKGETDLKISQLEFSKAILTDSLAREEERQQLQNLYQADLNRKTQFRNILLLIGLAVTLLALVFLSRMLYFRKRSDRFQSQTQQLEKQQLINEIDLLRTQVNPHFLFNSLSILSSLVHVNADLSEQFIEQLSRSYRYILEQKDQTLVTLRTELEFIHAYAFLLKIRFEHKFDLRIHLADAELDLYKIAPLTLQLLVENAVKHNRMSVAEPLVIEVLREQQFLLVKNRLQLRPQTGNSTRMGLNNIINRYGLLTDRPVWAGECGDEFVIKIPLLNN